MVGLVGRGPAGRNPFDTLPSAFTGSQTSSPRRGRIGRSRYTAPWFKYCRGAEFWPSNIRLDSKMWLALYVCTFHGLDSSSFLPPRSCGGNSRLERLCNLGFFARLWTVREYKRRTLFCRWFCGRSQHRNNDDCSNASRAKQIFGGRNRNVLCRERKE